MVKIAIDNSKCQKLVANVRFSLKRTIIATGRNTQGAKKEFKDEQEVMFGRFED